MMATPLRHEWKQLLHRRGREVINIYVYNVIGIDNEFNIGVKNFTVMSKAEDDNIFDAEVIVNLLAIPEAAIAPTEAGEIENQEA